MARDPGFTTLGSGAAAGVDATGAGASTLDSTGVGAAAAVGNAADATGAGATAADGTAAQSATASSIMLYNSPVTMGFHSTYGGIKDVIKQINNDPNRKSISTVTLAYDTNTGNLAGSITANMFFVKGTEKQYEAPAVPGVGVGTNNIFKAAESLNVTRDTVAAEGAATEDTEGDSTEAEE